MTQIHYSTLLPGDIITLSSSDDNTKYTFIGKLNNLYYFKKTVNEVDKWIIDLDIVNKKLFVVDHIVQDSDFIDCSGQVLRKKDMFSDIKDNHTETTWSYTITIPETEEYEQLSYNQREFKEECFIWSLEDYENYCKKKDSTKIIDDFIDLINTSKDKGKKLLLSILKKID